ncbi:MAG: molecular chaperone HtpG [Opitutales bacterium]|nr:molecular chaperone HtpG [Opitutales bacterium]
MTQNTVEKHEFQAEVRQVLDIVINSLYTDKEIFLRELVSNAADSLEKLRHHQLSTKDVFDAELPLEINITTDETAGTITVQDHGIGLTREELVENLGTIAHSGSKAFAQALKNAKESGEEGTDALQLIGQFGVGFYSAFMVASHVDLYTHSWKNEGEHLVWRSDGDGSYQIEPSAISEKRGAKIVLSLKDEYEEFAKAERVRELLRRYSSFVPFPILLNGERVNTVQAIWARSKNEIKPEEYSEFYKYQADAFDEPLFTLHFNVDAPLAINALLFTPENNPERFGFMHMDPGVSLYCKKVLIDAHPKGLLPDWLRFLKGVVDSADLPLNISRESMQDSSLVKKISDVVTGRFLKFLAEQAEKEPEKYAKFWKQFGIFIKEAITVDRAQHGKLGKLLRYESSLTEAGQTIGLSDYVGRMKEEQKEIYYLYGASRAAIESGPFVESFKAAGIEVLYLYEPADEFVMNHLHKFDDKELKSGDSADLKLDDVSAQGAGEALPEERMKALCDWAKEALGERVKSVEASKRLVDSPALAVNADAYMTPAMRRMMRAIREREGSDAPVNEVNANFELNAKHALVAKMDALRESNPELGKEVLEQLFDASLMAAGMLDSPQNMLKRMTKLLEHVS